MTEVPLWPAIGLVTLIAGAALNVNALAEQQREAHEIAVAHDVAVATFVDAETDIHRRSYHTVAATLYDNAATAHLTARDDAHAAIKEAKGKVDVKAEADAISKAGLIGGAVAAIHERTATLVEQAKAIRAKVKAYDDEQARLEAEREAAEQYSGGGQSTPAPSGSGVDYTLHVAGWGGQDLVDACVGAVHFSNYANGGLAEHWSCGGSSFPEWPGAVVEVVGEGLYRVTGVLAVLNYYTDDTGDLPGGYFYQTCYGGDPSQMVFIGLEAM